MFDKTTILFCKLNTSTYYSDAPSILWKDKSLFYHKSYLYVWHERSCQGGLATTTVGSSTPGDGASGMTGSHK